MARQTAAIGAQSLFTIVNAPRWANGNRAPRFAPSNVEEYGQFCGSVAWRYSGTYTPPGALAPLPAVKSFTVWNEPNRGQYLMPQGRDGQTAARTFAGARARLHRRRPRRLAGRARRRRARSRAAARRAARRRSRSSTAYNKAGGPRPQALAFNPYMNGLVPAFKPKETPADGAITLRNLDQLQRWLNRTYGGTVPIWFTEFAWRTAPTPSWAPSRPPGRPTSSTRPSRSSASTTPTRRCSSGSSCATSRPRATGARAWRRSTGSTSPRTARTSCFVCSVAARVKRVWPARCGPKKKKKKKNWPLLRWKEMLRLALAQLDLTVGALAENRKRIAEACSRRRAGGRRSGARPGARDLGLPAEDLLLRPAFLRACKAEAELLAAEVQVPLVVGCPWLDGDRVRNAALVIAGGEIVARYDKRELPNYGVFDEERTFAPGRGSLHIQTPGGALALTICEDVWLPDAVAEAAALGASCVLNISASPYHVGKGQSREEMLATRARDGLCAVAYCNLVGGQDELVFDGRSAVFGPDGACSRAPRRSPRSS